MSVLECILLFIKLSLNVCPNQNMYLALHCCSYCGCPPFCPWQKRRIFLSIRKRRPKAFVFWHDIFFSFQNCIGKHVFLSNAFLITVFLSNRFLDVISFQASILRVLLISDFSCIFHPFISEQCVCFSIFWILKS